MPQWNIYYLISYIAYHSVEALEYDLAFQCQNELCVTREIALVQIPSIRMFSIIKDFLLYYLCIIKFLSSYWQIPVNSKV